MRRMAIALIAALAACASGGTGADAPRGPTPFPVARGSALPPPSPGAAQAAPPEGQAGGGFDFGQWRGADPSAYETQFQARVAARAQGRSTAEIRADLAANGFACEDGARLDCRIEIMEQQCAHDWYVVVEPRQAGPIAGYDVMCLGAQR